MPPTSKFRKLTRSQQRLVKRLRALDLGEAEKLVGIYHIYYGHPIERCAALLGWTKPRTQEVWDSILARLEAKKTAVEKAGRLAFVGAECRRGRDNRQGKAKSHK